MADIDIVQLGKTYPDGTVALAPSDLHIDDGGFLVLVGPSGCGKSTLLRLIAGLEIASSGRIHIGTREVTSLPPERRDLAMVFQNYALYPHMDVAANLGFPLRMAGLPRAERERQVRAIAGMLELEPLLARRPGQLSGGQRQRVAMGRALIRRPAAFLLDEPLSNLDARLRAQMRAEVAGLQRRLGVTTLYVTHDQVEAMTMGDRICVLRAGHIQQVGDAATLYHRPVNRFVACFLGTPAMHLLRAQLRLDDCPPRLVWDGGSLTLDPTLLHHRPALAAEPARAVCWGLRPEHLRPDPEGPLELEIIHAELLGHECLVHCHPPWPVDQSDLDDALTGPLALRLPGLAAPAIGSRLRVNLNSADLIPFDATGRALG